MKKHGKLVALVMSGVMSVSVLGLTGCDMYTYTSEDMDEMALVFAKAMLGNDVFAWNVYSVKPYETYGYVAEGEPSWYSYHGALSKNEIRQNNYIFNLFSDELNHVNQSELTGATAASYRTMDNILDVYKTYYQSKYVNQFDLLGADYISSEGGYVADFATSFENFAFRNENDVKALLTVTQSTEDAFESYLDFAAARDKAGYPLYDYTVISMQDYLTDVYEKGDDYYLFGIAEKKIDDAKFLSQEKKNEYKTEYKTALKDKYMSGVKTLADGLEKYKSKVTETQKSYLASAGAVGKAYYEWLFRQKTGIKNANIKEVYNELVGAYDEYHDKRDKVLNDIDALQETDKATYDEFYEYFSETRFLLDLTEPTEILAYLKVAAKDIVPDLQTEPDIGFKYMDDTVAEISNAVAYYLRTPLDETNSREMITINSYQIENSPSDLLTTIAHEGYPGHLYAHVKSKESGTSLLSSSMSTTAFYEGWANYVELALLDHIANTETSNKAVQMYCEYSKYKILTGYVTMVLYDLQINYFGLTAAELESADMIKMMMEIPAVYVPYGYGMYTIYTLHEKAKTELGDKYDEVKYNGALLAEGFGPTLTRANEITNEYIKKNK